MEKGFLTKATQDELINLLKALLEKNEVKNAGLIAVGSNILLRLADDAFADKVQNEALKTRSQELFQKLVVDKEVDAGAIVEFILEIIDLFKKE